MACWDVLAARVLDQETVIYRTSMDCSIALFTCLIVLNSGQYCETRCGCWQSPELQRGSPCHIVVSPPMGSRSQNGFVIRTQNTAPLSTARWVTPYAPSGINFASRI